MRHLLARLARDLTAELEGRPALFLAPHPDDEVLGCGGVIARKVQSKTPVWIAYLTDGRAGIPGDPEAAAALREQEARTAASALGVPEDHLFFLRLPDGRLADHVEAARSRIRDLVEGLGIEDLFVPYGREYHPDHVAAYRIARACLRPGMHLYEYPIWYGPWIWRRLRGRARWAALAQFREFRRVVRIRVAEFLEAKQRALEVYRSQVAQFDALGTWGEAFLRGFLSPYEVFFEGP
ncbi:MAG: PIG-L deacetylase family protein [Armatimonadota bacterium]|nr:PIG-L deacetylase family protein [Armatimonadota bacterium]MDR7568505.1 PIG-L deacetylase family protein [Armatimonadota bacterium]